MSLGLDKPTLDPRFEAVESAQLWGMNRLALRRCQRALAKNPEDVRLRARCVYLEVLTKSKRADQAVEELRQMESPPRDPLMTQRLIAFCWSTSGDGDRAVAHLRRILAEHDDDETHCGLGELLAARKDYALAWEEFKRSERTEGFPCRRHLARAVGAARESKDRTGVERLLAKVSTIRRLSFKLSGSRVGTLALLLPLVVAFSVHWSVFDSWSAATPEIVAGAAVATGVAVMAIQMVAARHHWVMLILPASLIPMGWGAYLLGLQNRPGLPISHSLVVLGGALIGGPVVVMAAIVMRVSSRSGGPLRRSRRVG